MERSEVDRERERETPREDVRTRVREDIEMRLRHSGVALSGDESDDQVATIAEAVERFEDAVIAVGGDRFVDSADSSAPDHPDLVLPPRAADESPDAYVNRLQAAIDGIRSRAEGRAPDQG